MDNDKTISEKEQKKLLEIESFITNVTVGNIRTLVEKVGWILNHFPSARNSDTTCLIKYWQEFEPEILHNGMIYIEDLYKYTKLTSVVRARAKIQNDFKLFLASDEVRKHRGVLNEETTSWAITDQPDCGQYTVFVDESGKTNNYYILGSIWLLNSSSLMKFFVEASDFQKKEKYEHEFHFTDITESRESTYKGLIDLVYKYSESFSIKFIYISREGIDFNKIHKDLLYFLLLDGIKHECVTGRAPLPRSIQLYKDSESKGSDQLLLKELKERMKTASKIIFDNKLYINDFIALDSKKHFYLQIADIIASSINRKLSPPNQNISAKDRVADYFFSKFGLSLVNGKINSYSDISSSIDI